MDRAALAHELAARGAPDRDFPDCVERADGLFYPHTKEPSADEGRVAYLRACARVGGVPAGHGRSSALGLDEAIAAAKAPDWTTVLLRGLGHTYEDGTVTPAVEEAVSPLRALVTSSPPLPRRALALC